MTTLMISPQRPAYYIPGMESGIENHKKLSKWSELALLDARTLQETLSDDALNLDIVPLNTPKKSQVTEAELSHLTPLLASLAEGNLQQAQLLLQGKSGYDLRQAIAADKDTASRAGNVFENQKRLDEVAALKDAAPLTRLHITDDASTLQNMKLQTEYCNLAVFNMQRQDSQRFMLRKDTQSKQQHTWNQGESSSTQTLTAAFSGLGVSVVAVTAGSFCAKEANSHTKKAQKLQDRVGHFEDFNKAMTPKFFDKLPKCKNKDYGDRTVFPEEVKPATVPNKSVSTSTDELPPAPQQPVIEPLNIPRPDKTTAVVPEPAPAIPDEITAPTPTPTPAASRTWMVSNGTQPSVLSSEKYAFDSEAGLNFIGAPGQDLSATGAITSSLQTHKKFVEMRDHPEFGVDKNAVIGRPDPNGGSRNNPEVGWRVTDNFKRDAHWEGKFNKVLTELLPPPGAAIASKPATPPAGQPSALFASIGTKDIRGANASASNATAAALKDTPPAVPSTSQAATRPVQALDDDAISTTNLSRPETPRPDYDAVSITSLSKPATPTPDKKGAISKSKEIPAPPPVPLVIAKRDELETYRMFETVPEFKGGLNAEFMRFKRTHISDEGVIFSRKVFKSTLKEKNVFNRYFLETGNLVVYNRFVLPIEQTEFEDFKTRLSDCRKNDITQRVDAKTASFNETRDAIEALNKCEKPVPDNVREPMLERMEEVKVRCREINQVKEEYERHKQMIETGQSKDFARLDYLRKKFTVLKGEFINSVNDAVRVIRTEGGGYAKEQIQLHTDLMRVEQTLAKKWDQAAMVLFQVFATQFAQLSNASAHSALQYNISLAQVSIYEDDMAIQMSNSSLSISERTASEEIRAMLAALHESNKSILSSVEATRRATNRGL